MKIRKTMYRIAVCVAIACGGALGAQTADPFTLTLPEGYPQFAKQSQTTKGTDGNIETTNWIAKAPTGEAVIVTVSTMPGKILDAKKMMTSTRDSLLKSLNATIESDAPGAGDASTENLTFHSAGAVFRAHFEVIDKQFYQLLYVGRSNEQRDAPAVQQLFESFKIASAAQ